MYCGGYTLRGTQLHWYCYDCSYTNTSTIVASTSVVSVYFLFLFVLSIAWYNCNKDRENPDRERRVVLKLVIDFIIDEHRVKISLFNFSPYFNYLIFGVDDEIR
jgi:hypothetical protein